MEYLSARIPLLASDLLAHIVASGYSGNIDHDDIMLWLHEYSQITKARPVELQFVRPDFESIKQQLQSRLSERDSWKGLLQAEVGATLLELIATVGAYSQLSIQRSLQDSMLDTARLTSSVYLITRMLGVHIARKTPANVTVQLVGNGKVVQIPTYSQFSINGIYFFNRDQIILTATSPTATVVLYQGQILIDEVASNGKGFQRFEVGNSDFNISDTDICVVDSDYAKFERVTDGLWHHGGDKYVFFENTTPSGNVEILFGNNLHGRIPPVNERLSIIYASTLGEEAHSGATNLSVSIIEFNDFVADRLRTLSPIEKNSLLGAVTGHTVSPILGGDNEKDKEFYKALAPHIYAAKGKIVTRNDYHAMALLYPGLVDVYIQGQRELAAKNPAYLNVVGITPLKKNGGVMTDSEFDRFVLFLRENAVMNMQYLHIPPSSINLNIKAKVNCLPGTDLPKMKTYIEYKIAEQFGVRRGSLGHSIYLNDLHSVLRSRHQTLQVDFAELHDPGIDILVKNTDYINIASLDIDLGFSSRNYVGFIKP